MNLKEVSDQVEKGLSGLFAGSRSGIPAREDSRAFGAMIEKRITDNWERICADLGYSAMEQPGPRTIYDFAFRKNDQIVGIDVKTKDLDTKSYSDGGICAVANLLRFLANDKGVFLIAEFGHRKASEERQKRDIEYLRVAPLFMLPLDAFRIENLGTGQVRLNSTLDGIWDRIEWDRGIDEFYDQFIALSKEHYRTVSSVAMERIEALETFRSNGYRHFTFG